MTRAATSHITVNKAQANMQMVAELMFKHYSVREIAEKLGMSVGWTQKWTAKVREEWQERRKRDIEIHYDEQLARLDLAETAILPKVLEGYPPALERWLQLMDMRNKMMGLYAPTKTEVDIGKQLAALVSSISEEPEPEPRQLPAPQIEIIEGESEDLN